MRFYCLPHQMKKTKLNCYFLPGGCGTIISIISGMNTKHEDKYSI